VLPLSFFVFESSKPALLKFEFLKLSEACSYPHLLLLYALLCKGFGLDAHQGWIYFIKNPLKILTVYNIDNDNKCFLSGKSAF